MLKGGRIDHNLLDKSYLETKMDIKTMHTRNFIGKILAKQ